MWAGVDDCAMHARITVTGICGSDNIFYIYNTHVLMVEQQSTDIQASLNSHDDDGGDDKNSPSEYNPE